jgi:hypothetical protein
LLLARRRSLRVRWLRFTSCATRRDANLLSGGR